MTRRLVLRLGRRRASWEKTSPQDIAAVEFQDRATGGLDLRPSVYVLDPDTDTAAKALVVRVRAEHSASFASPPRPSHGTHQLDLEGASNAALVRCAGETKFAFRKRRSFPPAN